MAATFLQRSRHKSVYYFRRKVPLDLRAVVSATVVYKSLVTTMRRDAVVLARALAARTDQIFRELRAMGKKKDDTFRVDFGLTVDLDELTGKKRVTVHDIQPGEEEAATKALLDVHHRVMASAAPPAPPTPAIKAAVDLYFEEDKETKPRTKQRYDQFLREFVRHFGAETPLGSVTQTEFNKYADAIKAAGRNWNTQRNYIGTAARFLNWSRIRGRTPHTISAATLKPQRRTPARRDRGAFTHDELRAIFENAAQFRLSKRHAKFWVTVASAFLGGRINELAQLDFDKDLRQLPDGTWYISIQENHAEEDWKLRQSAKTMASWRDLPLHSALVRHGFIDFLMAEKRAGAKRPFERYWKPYIREQFQVVVYSHKITKWGGRELEKLRKAGKISTPNVAYFHSHRHTLATELAKQGVTEEVRAAIAGQEYGGINNAVYNKLKDSPQALAPLIEKHLQAYAQLLDEVMRQRVSD